MLNMKLVISISAFFSFIFLVSCGPKEPEKPFVIDELKLQNEINKAHKPAVTMEKDNIDFYIKNHGYKMDTTGTGIRYMFINKLTKRKLIESGNRIKVEYKVSLLDGSVCYSSEGKGPKEFEVDHGNIESGVHQAVKMMCKGEKALFILPMHLAHGTMGDGDKIPPLSSVVYEIEIVEVND